jgi:ketosteroid isomerase-like protein
MSNPELDLAQRFVAVLEWVAGSGDTSALYPFLADHVEWVMPMRTLNGIDDVRQNLTWAAPHKLLDLEFDPPQLTDAGDGVIVAEARETYVMRATGDLAFTRDRRITLTIRDDRIVRYEMRIVG